MQPILYHFPNCPTLFAADGRTLLRAQQRRVAAFLQERRPGRYLIDATGAIRGEVSVPFRWLPHVEKSTKQPGRMIFSSFSPQTRHAYSGCAVTERFVYALYQGHLNVDAGVKNYFARLPPAEVQVFDMSFKLVKTFVLDHATSVLAVPPGDTVLFSAIYDSTGVQVRRTRIP